MSYTPDPNFLSEYEAMDYIDAMYNDGIDNETLIEDHLADDDRAVPMQDAEGSRGSFTPAHIIANEMGETWNDIEALPIFHTA